MKKKAYYLIGDTYSRDVLPYLETLAQSRELQLINSLEDVKNKSQWIVLSPTIDHRALEICGESELKVAVIFDWNHFGFKEFEPFLNLKAVKKIYAPFRTKRDRLYPSLHGEMMKSKVKIADNINTTDYFFCSQPLEEDRAMATTNQHTILKQLISLAQTERKNVFIKRHPREKDLGLGEWTHHPNVRLWNDSIEAALAHFKNWVGFNSIALYDAQALGHNVSFGDKPNRRKNIMEKVLVINRDCSL